jgi:purine-binding chemotaxis protein CheW
MTSAAKEPMEQQQYLTFILSGEEYAIDILRVKEIIGYDTVTTVPRTPQWIRGVINLRGNVVPVLDLAVRFGLGEEPVTKTSCIIIVEWQQENRETMMGVVADSVNQVMDISVADVQPVPAFGTCITVEYLQGMVEQGKKFAMLLNINKVLSAGEIASLDEAVIISKETDPGAAELTQA